MTPRWASLRIRAPGRYKKSSKLMVYVPRWSDRFRVAHLTVCGRSVICGASWLDVDNSSNVLEVSGASNRPANLTDFANSFPQIGR